MGLSIMAAIVSFNFQNSEGIIHRDWIWFLLIVSYFADIALAIDHSFDFLKLSAVYG